MTQKIFNKKGFTLIELLVVVLIIGILAAIAVPQYQKAVGKSEMQEALLQARALLTAQTEYELANGSFATDLNLLSLNFPNNDWVCASYFCQLQNPRNARLEFSRNNTILYCIANDERKQKQCLSLGGQYSYSNGNFHYYIVHTQF